MADMVNHHHPLLHLLVEQLGHIARASGYAVEDVIDLEQCCTILEVTGGDIDQASQLYWDDYLARQNQQQQQQHPAIDLPAMAAVHAGRAGNHNNNEVPQVQDQAVVALAPRDRRDINDSNPTHNNNNDNNDDDRHHNSRIRRRLENDFNGQIMREQQQQPEEEEEIIGNDVNDEIQIRLLENATIQRRGSKNNNNNDDDVNLERMNRANDGNNNVDAEDSSISNANVGRLVARAAELFANRRRKNEIESVSISDDESSDVWKVMGGMAATLRNHHQYTHDDNSDDDEDEEGRPFRKRRKTNDHVQKEPSIDEDGYLSDHDWIWDSCDNRKQIPLSDPFDFLWGLPTSVCASQAIHSAPRPAQPEPERQVEVEGNVIADDDDDDDDDNNGDEGSHVEQQRSGIPKTWLNTGFSLAEDGMGLVLPSPGDDDISFYGWQQQANGSVRDPPPPPPPYHCGSISALLSIVTGLLYTGVSYQKLSISASSARIPFAQLSLIDKKREFESRLADVLAVLLQIAAKSSLTRKNKALNKLKKSKDPADIRKWQTIERKLRLCPTCWWETDGSGELRLPSSRDSERLQIATSYTNVEELRSYVLSNMRSFTAKGGCALFLETIIRIHGKGVIQRMIQKARQEVDPFSSQQSSLIHCTCEDLHKDLKIPPQQLRQRAKTKELMEALPRSSTCISIELISLLLTGRVHSTLKGWSTGVLGLGLLSYSTNEIGKGLTRPNKPVWILQGPSTYSVIWMSHGYEKDEVFAKVDQPDAVVEMTHFSCWPSQRHTSILRLSCNRYPRSENKTLTSTCLSELEPIDPHLSVRDDELVGVHVNEEDSNLYKDNYRMWRFQFDNNENPTEETPKCWIPFYQLTQRQKLIVETKLGPKINTILWKRWPHALIEMTDNETTHPVV